MRGPCYRVVVQTHADVDGKALRHCPSIRHVRGSLTLILLKSLRMSEIDALYGSTRCADDFDR